MKDLKVVTSQFQLSGKELSFRLGFDLSKRNHKMVHDHLTSGRFYEPDVSSLLVRILEPGDIFIDIGSNQGFFTVLGSCLVGKLGRVFACEPDAENRNDISTNIELNKSTNITVIPHALSSKPELREFYTNHIDSGGHALWDITAFPGNEREGGPIAVASIKTKTLDQIVLENHLPGEEIKCIKIDTEGAEEIILRGGLKVLESGQVDFVITELHEFGLQKLSCSQESLRGLMNDLGYQCFVLGTKGGFPYFIPPGVRIESRFIVNLCFTREPQLRQAYPKATVDVLGF